MTQTAISSACVAEVPPLYVTGYAATDAGVVRSSNQDTVAFTIPDKPGVLQEKGFLAVVADGMGGHAGGEIASLIAADVVTKSYYAASGDPYDCLRQAFEAANQRIYEKARSNPQLVGMGTTCTAMAVVNGLGYCAYVGDSRTYLLRGGQMYCMTEDHSAPMELFHKGILSLAEARTHEDRNIILRALGTHPAVAPALWNAPVPLRDDDRLLLCSDGLYEKVDESELAIIAASHRHPSGACRELIRLAAERMSSDNVSVILLHLRRRPDTEIEEQKEA